MVAVGRPEMLSKPSWPRGCGIRAAPETDNRADWFRCAWNDVVAPPCILRNKCVRRIFTAEICALMKRKPGDEPLWRSRACNYVVAPNRMLTTDPILGPIWAQNRPRYKPQVPFYAYIYIYMYTCIYIYIYTCI